MTQIWKPDMKFKCYICDEKFSFDDIAPTEFGDTSWFRPVKRLVCVECVKKLKMNVDEVP